MRKDDGLFHHDFFDGPRKTNKEIKDFLSATTKPIKYTYGLKYRNPTTYMVHKSLAEALEIVDNEGLLTVNEYEDYIDMNAYSSNDMW